MTNFFYTDANGRKRGPFDAGQLRVLAAQGIITPNTPLETGGGHKGLAGQVSGLFNVSPSQPVVPVAKGSKGPLLVALVGIVVILAVGGVIVRKIVNSGPKEPL